MPIDDRVARATADRRSRLTNRYVRAQYVVSLGVTIPRLLLQARSEPQDAEL